jgi:hypothetical protein
MGHAGAIISGGKGTADEKLSAMREAGIITVDTPAAMGRTVKEALQAHNGTGKAAAAKKPAAAKASAAAKPATAAKKSTGTAAKKPAPKKK